MTARPRAITVIAWVFVVVGAAGVLADLWPLVTPDAGKQLAQLKADFIAEVAPAWSLRLAAVVGGVWLLRGRNWARWLLVGWMALHVGISALHSWQQVVMHTVIFALITYVLFRSASAAYFQASPSAAG
jgi:hypothetical protein